ncbi:GNAT family N-acetyltransferase [Quisquiliibacterium transsilvanicum]|uniref:CelD/BcsL family acetyltransferase involved in cellulose biosynthesis n=1 Tax=Quisquiliibacterium transsilvanicum TaxID=1549638 RepID=A0A7W8HDS8_9BURK|nr:GNAT family N-acetyltransferase [Quisquiliibacterium transsilvanicum]MBB5270022.1 CelD/BcsL family acetyltransferase involved in cellulose biosynthesis [Quisquiliibacterium transsilvanicum]
MTAAIDRPRLPALDWSLVPAHEHARWTRAWDELNRRGCRSPLIQSWFLLPALRHFGTGEELVAIGRREPDTPAAMMLLTRPAALRCEGFQPSQAPLAAVLLAPGEDVADAARSLLRALPGTVLALTLLHLDERFVAMPAAAPDVEISPRFETGAIFVGHDFADYYAAIPTRARKNLERRLRKAEAEIGPASLQVWESAERIDEFLHLYSDTESRGWKGEAGTAVGFDDAQGLFYRDMLRAAAERGDLRMFVLMFGDRPAAQQIAIDCDGITYFLKTTYDESLSAYAPGVIQRYLILEWSQTREPPTRDFEIYGQVKEAIAPFITGTRHVYHLTVLRYRAIKAPLGLVRWVKRRAAS